MPVLSALEIYRYARLGGFSPDQAVTMTAIALAESGGNPGSHNPVGENSQGLWQINAAAHPNYASQNLYDPLVNARAAFEVSHSGQDVSPWTTAHGLGTAKYIGFRAEAQAAARSAGDDATGVWTGTAGYGHPLAAGGGGGGGGAADFLMTGSASGSASPGAGGDHRSLDTFVNDALGQAGDPYVWGASPNLHDPNPTGFDCSSLVEWAAGQVGVDLPRTSYGQYLALQEQHSTISVEQALHTRGALLFDFSTPPTPGGGRPSTAHVAISLGDGRTIEAMDTKHGVLTATASASRFNYAAVIPGLGTSDPTASTGATPTLAGTTGAAGGSPTDWLEKLLVSDAFKVDGDGDGISDGYEAFVMHTDPTKVDSDGDGISDAIALLRGIDPTSPGGGVPGQLDGGLGTGAMPDPFSAPGSGAASAASAFAGTSLTGTGLPDDPGLSPSTHLPIDPFTGV